MSKEEIARAVQKAVEEEMTTFSYKVSNATLKALEVKETVENIGNGGAAIQAGWSAGQTGFSALEDFSRNDKLCTGLCIAATCFECVAFTSRIVKFPGGMKVYVVSKSASCGLMRFRNLCRNAQGQIINC